jgi:hypothetical protein
MSTTAASAIIQRLLVDIERHVQSPEWASDPIVPLLEQISKLLKVEEETSVVAEGEKALLSSLMLQSDTPCDLLQFVEVTKDSDTLPTRRVRVKALQVVTHFIKQLGEGPHLERNALAAADKCWALITLEKSNEVKAAALKALRALIKLQPACLAENRWDVARKMLTLVDTYRAKPKPAQSVRSEVLKLQGALVNVYGYTVPEVREQVVPLLRR